MEFLIIVAYVQSLAVSLGVGSSTIAICNYIVAVRDNTIDTSERSIMGVTYTILRVAMAAIVLTLLIQAIAFIPEYGLAYFQPFILFVWLIVAVLFANAVLMTKHFIPRTVGPALQAVSWYTLGTLYFLSTIYATTGSFGTYIVWYGIALLVVSVLLNAVIAFVKRRAPETKVTK